MNALPPSIVESSINLVRHSDVQVQYEGTPNLLLTKIFILTYWTGYELLKDLIRRASLQDQIIRELIVILRVVPITEDSEDSDGI